MHWVICFKLFKISAKLIDYHLALGSLSVFQDVLQNLGTTVFFVLMWVVMFVLIWLLFGVVGSSKLSLVLGWVVLLCFLEV